MVAIDPGMACAVIVIVIVNSLSCSRRTWVAVAVLLLVAFSSAQSATKPIRLRNETILPESATPMQKMLVGPQSTGAVSGLYLIQFREPPNEQIRLGLRRAGVTLLHYVPQDTYVARCRNARLTELQRLPFIEWTGAYRPEHKVHPNLLKLKSQAAGKPIGVALLLAPGTSRAEIAAMRGWLTTVEQASTLRSGTVLRGQLDPQRLDAAARSDVVLWIEPAWPMKLFDEVASKIVAGDGGPQTLLSQSLGFDGRGVDVAVADTGLNNGDAATMHPDLLGRTPAFMWYGQLTDAADEHSHGTHVAGIVAGDGATGETDANGALYGLGVAPGASIIAQRIFDGDGNFEAPPSNEKLTRDATRAGAVIGSNSWGDDTQGQYDVSAMEFDELVRDADALKLGDQPYILEFSAGNAGPGAQTIGSPAVGKNVLATGASENDRTDMMIYTDGPDVMADFSSRGPCEDGRIKPDVVCPGTWISSLQSESATDQNAWAPIDNYYQYQGGTSQAGPHASGAAAVFVQYYRQSHDGATPSPALVKATLINSTTDLYYENFTPNYDEGWGRIDLTRLLASALSFDFTDQTVLLTNGQVFERRIVVADGSEPFKATLAYTDVPGFPGAAAALVNDLDLEVVAPDGTVYRGNQFDNGESIPNASVPDNVNNVEGVFLSMPASGEYLVRVRARNVVQDARDDTPAIDQDFALVISAVILPPGQGTINLDRGAYTAPSQIRISLFDSDLAGQSTATVTIKSTTEPNGENVVLTATGAQGGFGGTIATATGPAAADGRLEIGNNDVIQATYFDASAGVNRIASARADLVPPVLTGVSATTQFGQTVVAWQTDEPATSIVRFGTTSGVGQVVTNAKLTTNHSIELSGLTVGQTYYFLVVSADEAGNFATNSNGGALFTFVAPQPRTVLLVDAFVSNGADNDIPLSVYTDTLDQLGISYDAWVPGTIGRSPGTNDMAPYRMLIWRFNDGVFSSDTLSADEQQAIRSYLNHGGAFFMASMEQLTRLGAGAFRRDVLHVDDFVEDAGVPSADGLNGSAISGGMSLTLDYSQYDCLFHQLLGVPDDISDTMVLRPEADPILLEPSSGGVAGLGYPRVGEDSSGRVVYLSFPLDAVSTTDSAPNNRATLLGNIIRFLVPGVNGVGTIALDSPAYRIPSTVTVEVGDSDLAGKGTASVNFFSTTQTTAVPGTLGETEIRGLFRGTIDLIWATNPPAPGKLRAQNGDSIWAEYFDASVNATVRATAAIDITPPVITEVQATPDYVDATVTWTTSEPGDSLVQFGESPLLNRTASDAGLVTDHAVTLPGLLPDKTYYFQVTSRDVAGNSATDDNQGKLYPFHTLQPIVPPWSDNMDTGATNWTIYSSSDSQTDWTLGVPNNGQMTQAHSQPDCWGSNLGGAAIDTDEVFLISPAIYLTGGNVATLRFWHAYDFSVNTDTDILEYGQVMVITNNAASPVAIATYSDDTTPDWTPETIDLTPYLGQVIYLVWDYELFSFDTRSRPGWLVDDVSITMSTVQAGTVQITNNLWQGTYVLSGPLYLKSKGLGTVLTNAPPGQYVLEFADVPYYVTPGPQTNILFPGGSITLKGVYTFPDSNHNGISDLWEQAFFGSVSSNRTASTDTDGDGMTDYAEFMAGTNPTNALSNLEITAEVLDSVRRLEWSSVIGRGYQVLGSADAITWTPVSPWFQATAITTAYELPAPSPGGPWFFRVQVRP